MSLPPLDVAQKQPVKYCIPPWLRDEQIKRAIALPIARIQELTPPPTGSVAVVGYGPSLRETWEQVRDFPHIISCSGSHRFLLDRGVVPTWHVEVDPRPHKIQLLGAPDPRVTYLVASTCHPEYFAHLRDQRVQLWHVFDATEDALRLLPEGEWAITGGCDVGLRAITIAAFLGFRDLHVFGMDGSGAPESHAGPHPHAVPAFHPCTVDGRTFQTTPALLAAAQSVRHELDQLPGITVRFYGDGLIQHLVRDYVPKVGATFTGIQGTIAARKPVVISAPYRALNQQLHRENMAYGVGGASHARTVLKIAEALHTRSILDYGCGKGYLAAALPFPIWEYDPAVPGKEASPRAADLVVCTDVLEHIEPDHLEAVLGDLQRCVKDVAYVVIHTGPATKTLPDGRNAHLIQQDVAWWVTTLQRFFTVGKPRCHGPLLTLILSRKRLVQGKAA